ncbi:MAG: response regulator [Lachnospiraceae bacterium]|nr:response regulator [Lachnospiraceae bacterium]
MGDVEDILNFDLSGIMEMLAESEPEEDTEGTEEKAPVPKAEPERNILVISATEPFSVRSILEKLKNNGIKAEHVHAILSEITEKQEKYNLLLYYLEDGAPFMSGVLEYLSDLCSESDKSLILIGSRVEYESVLNVIPENCILRWYERPLNLSRFMEEVTALIDENNNEEQKKHILVVDDDPSYLRTVRGWLKADYHVAMVNSGMNVIMWLAKNHADMILLDYMMPVMSGPEILEMLRNEPETKDIPVFFLTGKGDRESIMKVLRLKPDGYILKSSGRGELLSALKEFFAKQKAV